MNQNFSYHDQIGRSFKRLLQITDALYNKTRNHRALRQQLIELHGDLTVIEDAREAAAFIRDAMKEILTHAESLASGHAGWPLYRRALLDCLNQLCRHAPNNKQ